MTFGNLLSVILFGYICYYLGMIIYDQYFKKDDIPLEAAVEEEEIDISDDAKEFQPVTIVKDNTRKDLSKEEESEQEVMSGRIEIEDLIPKINELAEKGKDSPLGKIVAGWNEIPQAA